MSTLTADQRWLVRRYYLYQIFTNLWFIGAIWLYFYRLFINDQQVGFLDAAAFTAGLIAQIPSGALADRFGRARLVRIGQVLTGAGLLIQASGSSFLPLFVGQSIVMIGVAFASGADEALFFDKLHFDRESIQWRRLVTRGSQIALIGSLVATVAGGWMQAINPRVPWVIVGLCFITAALIIWPIKDQQMKARKQKTLEEVKEYLRDIRVGFAQFLRPELRLYVPIILTVQALFYTTGWGLLRIVLLSRFHFSPLLGSLAVASSSLLTVGALALTHRYAERLSERRVITAISLGAAASLLLSVADIGLWGYFVILVLYLGEHVLYPFMSETLNYHAEPEQRATLLSVAAFLKSMPYVALAPLIGTLNVRGELNYFLITWPVLILLSVLIYLALKKRDTYIKLDTELVE